MARKLQDEVADKMPDVSNAVMTLAIKAVVQESCNMKWQKRANAVAQGKQLFYLWRSVNVQEVAAQNIKTQE